MKQKFVEKCNFFEVIIIKVKKFIYTFSRSVWETEEIDYLCHLSLFKVVNTFTDINYFLQAVFLSF